MKSWSKRGLEPSLTTLLAHLATNSIPSSPSPFFSKAVKCTKGALCFTVKPRHVHTGDKTTTTSETKTIHLEWSGKTKHPKKHTSRISANEHTAHLQRWPLACFFLQWFLPKKQTKKLNWYCALSRQTHLAGAEGANKQSRSHTFRSSILSWSSSTKEGAFIPQFSYVACKREKTLPLLVQLLKTVWSRDKFFSYHDQK